MRRAIRNDEVPPECIYCPAYDLSNITKEAVEESNRMAREKRPELKAKPPVAPIIVERIK